MSAWGLSQGHPTQALLLFQYRLTGLPRCRKTEQNEHTEPLTERYPVSNSLNLTSEGHFVQASRLRKFNVVPNFRPLGIPELVSVPLGNPLGG
jgi:hypothetical protein